MAFIRWGLWCMCSFFPHSTSLDLCVHTGQDVIYRKLTHSMPWTSDRSTSEAIGHGSKNALKCMSICPPFKNSAYFVVFCEFFVFSFFVCEGLTAIGSGMDFLCVNFWNFNCNYDYMNLAESYITYIRNSASFMEVFHLDWSLRLKHVGSVDLFFHWMNPWWNLVKFISQVMWSFILIEKPRKLTPHTCYYFLLEGLSKFPGLLRH